MYPGARLGLIALIVIIGAVWSPAQAADSIVGSWRLLSYVEEETQSKAVHPVLGDNPSGVITYTPDGRMSVFIVGGQRKRPAAAVASDAEAVELYRTMLAYAGSYSVDGNKVIHKIELSWNQAWSGTDQPRFVEIRDNRLTIKTAPSVSAISGKESVRTLVWERIK